MSGAARAVFLDRDGTLTEDRGYTYRVEDLRLLPGVVDGLRRLDRLGFRLVITTNQSGVARGYFTEAQAEAFHVALVARLAAAGVPVAAVYSCPFHPTAGVGPYRRESELRKPRPGMILRAAAEHGLDLAASYAVGDKRGDVAAGRAAGCRTILLRTGTAGAGEPELVVEPDWVADDLAAAAAIIAANEGTMRAVRTERGGP
jgi:D-glycero-D-manno-heptose 1,7-bisphosphate phosphatase